MRSSCPVRRVALFTRATCALAASLLSAQAIADATITYRVDGTCTGDFDEVQLKDHWLRADSHQGGDNSMVYDGAEKLAYFIDHGAHTFMQVELDEDAIDLQKDVMTSLGKNMKHRAGFDPFQMASSLCPGLANQVDSRDRQPDEPIDCGNGATIGADGKSPGAEQLAAAMKGGQTHGMTAESQQMLQKMMEQQMAGMSPEQQAQMQQMMGSGGAGMPAGGAATLGMPGAGDKRPPASAPPRIDRDAGEIQVDGIACMRRQHLRGDTMLREDCYATVATLKLGDVETKRLARFSKSLQDWSQSMVPAGMGGVRDKPDDRVLLQRTCYEAGRESGHATLTIDRSPIAESRFALPAGYTPMDLGERMQQGAQGRR